MGYANIIASGQADHRDNEQYVNRELFQNLIQPRVYVWPITRSTMFEKAPFC